MRTRPRVRMPTPRRPYHSGKKSVAERCIRITAGEVAWTSRVNHSRTAGATDLDRVRSGERVIIEAAPC